MKTVNLLPPWYLQQQRQRSHFRAHLAVMLLLAGAMAGAWAVGKDHVSKLEERRAALAKNDILKQDLTPRLTREQADLKRLQDLQLAYRELGKTIPMSAVIQQIRNDMAPGMALSNVQIEVRADPIKGTGNVGDARNPPRYRDVAYIEVEGIAPNDVQIAQLIEKLSLNPLFSEVALPYTRMGAMQNFLVRRFQVKMKMDLDRLSIEEADTSKVALVTPDSGASNGH